MRCICAVLLINVFPCVAVFAQQKQNTHVSSEWIYASRPLRWESPPRKTGLHIRTASATVLVLYPDGRYLAVGCLLIKQADGKIVISNGDGFVVRHGTWNQFGETLSASRRVVFRTVQVAGQTMPEPLDRQEYSVRMVKGEKQLLTLNGEKYKPLPEFVDLANLESFAPQPEREMK